MLRNDTTSIILQSMLSQPQVGLHCSNPPRIPSEPVQHVRQFQQTVLSIISNRVVERGRES